MKRYSIMPMLTDHVVEICNDIEAQYRDGVAEEALFIFRLQPEGNPTTDKALIFCKQYELFAKELGRDIERIREIYREYYTGGLVRFVENADEGGFLSAAALSGRDDMQITVCGNDDRILLVARFDNLGKGASGAAIQNMNILLGVDESIGLVC